MTTLDHIPALLGQLDTAVGQLHRALQALRDTRLLAASQCALCLRVYWDPVTGRPSRGESSPYSLVNPTHSAHATLHLHTHRAHIAPLHAHVLELMETIVRAITTIPACAQQRTWPDMLISLHAQQPPKAALYATILTRRIDLWSSAMGTLTHPYEEGHIHQMCALLPLMEGVGTGPKWTVSYHTESSTMDSFIRAPTVDAALAWACLTHWPQALAGKGRLEARPHSAPHDPVRSARHLLRGIAQSLPPVRLSPTAP